MHCEHARERKDIYLRFGSGTISLALIVGTSTSGPRTMGLGEGLLVNGEVVFASPYSCQSGHSARFVSLWYMQRRLSRPS